MSSLQLLGPHGVPDVSTEAVIQQAFPHAQTALTSIGAWLSDEGMKPAGTESPSWPCCLLHLRPGLSRASICMRAIGRRKRKWRCLSTAGAFGTDSLRQSQSRHPTRDHQQRTESPVHTDRFSYALPPSRPGQLPWPAARDLLPWVMVPRATRPHWICPAQKGAKGPGLSVRTPLPPCLALCDLGQSHKRRLKPRLASISLSVRM